MERTPHNIVRQDRTSTKLRGMKEVRFRKIGFLRQMLKEELATTQSTTRLWMQTIAWRAPGENPTRIQRYSSQSTNKTAKSATIWRQRRIRLRRWPENRLEVLQTVAGKPVIVVNVGPNPVEDEQVEFSAFSKPWRLVIFLKVRTGFGCLEKNLQPTDGRCEQNTRKYSTYTVHRIITLHHANTRGSSLRIAHLCVLKTIAVHVSCLIPCRTWHWLQAQVLSHPFHPHLVSFRRSHTHKQALRISTQKYPAMVHGRVADQHKSHLSHLLRWWISICHLKKAELEPKLHKYKGRVVLRGDIVKDDSWSLRSNGCHCKIARLWRTSSWCSVCLHSSKFGGRSQIAQNSQVRMSKNYGYVFHDTKGPNRGQTLNIQCSSCAKFVRTHTCWPLVGKTIWESSVGTRMGQSTELGMSFCSSKTSLFIGNSGLYQNGWKKAES